MDAATGGAAAGPFGPDGPAAGSSGPNGLFYQARNGCSWRNLPHDLPPWNVVGASFRRWRDNGTLERVHEALCPLVRQQVGKPAQPMVGILGSQAVHTAGKRGVLGFAADKHITGRKRYLLVDLFGLVRVVCLQPASEQDRCGAATVLAEAGQHHPQLH